MQDIQSNLHGINNTSILAARRGFPPSAVELRDYVASKTKTPLKEPPPINSLREALVIPISIDDKGQPLLGVQRIACITNDALIVGERPVLPNAKLSWSKVDRPPQALITRLEKDLSPEGIL